jgi:hypothetical protein
LAAETTADWLVFVDRVGFGQKVHRSAPSGFGTKAAAALMVVSIE